MKLKKLPDQTKKKLYGFTTIIDNAHECRIIVILATIFSSPLSLLVFFLLIHRNGTLLKITNKTKTHQCFTMDCA